MVSQLQAVRSGENTESRKVAEGLSFTALPRTSSVPCQSVSLQVEGSTDGCCLVWEGFTHSQWLVPVGPASGSPHLLWEAALRDTASAWMPGRPHVCL